MRSSALQSLLNSAGRRTRALRAAEAIIDPDIITMKELSTSTNGTQARSQRGDQRLGLVGLYVVVQENDSSHIETEDHRVFDYS